MFTEIFSTTWFEKLFLLTLAKLLLLTVIKHNLISEAYGNLLYIVLLSTCLINQRLTEQLFKMSKGDNMWTSFLWSQILTSLLTMADEPVSSFHNIHLFLSFTLWNTCYTKLQQFVKQKLCFKFQDLLITLFSYIFWFFFFKSDQHFKISCFKEHWRLPLFTSN